MMTGKLDWPPAMIDCSTVDDDLINRLWDAFYDDFCVRRPTFRGRPVWWNNRLLPTPFGDLEDSFWHLISRENKKTCIRYFEAERAQYIRWCTATIRNADEQFIRVWDKPHHGGKVRTYLSQENFEYLVILQIESRGDRGEVAKLISAYDIKPYHTETYKGDYEEAAGVKKCKHRP